MKTKLTLFFAAVVLLSGCNWIKDLDDVNISTNLKMDIPVVVAPQKSLAVNSEKTGIDFSVSQDLNLGDNEDVEPYLEKIKSIDINSLSVTITGLNAGETINSISLGVTGVGTICTQTNITSSNNTFTPVIDNSLLSQAADKLKKDRKITVTAFGNVSGPMQFTVKLDFNAKVTANALD